MVVRVVMRMKIVVLLVTLMVGEVVITLMAMITMLMMVSDENDVVAMVIRMVMVVAMVMTMEMVVAMAMVMHMLVATVMMGVMTVVMRRMAKCDGEVMRGHYGDDNNHGAGDSDDCIADDGGDPDDNKW